MNVRLSRFIVLASLIAALSGCGDKKKPDGPEISGVTITGKLLQNGKPFKILPDETIKVVFMSAEGKEKSRAEPMRKKMVRLKSSGHRGKACLRATIKSRSPATFTGVRERIASRRNSR